MCSLAAAVRAELAPFCDPEGWTGGASEFDSYRNEAVTDAATEGCDCVRVVVTRFGVTVGVECGSFGAEVDSGLGEFAVDVRALLAAARAYSRARSAAVEGA